MVFLLYIYLLLNTWIGVFSMILFAFLPSYYHPTILPSYLLTTILSSYYHPTILLPSYHPTILPSYHPTTILPSYLHVLSLPLHLFYPFNNIINYLGFKALDYKLPKWNLFNNHTILSFHINTCKILGLSVTSFFGFTLQLSLFHLPLYHLFHSSFSIIFLIIVSLDSFSILYLCFPYSFVILNLGFNRVGNLVFDNSLFILILFFFSVGMVNINMLFSVQFEVIFHVLLRIYFGAFYLS